MTDYQIETSDSVKKLMRRFVLLYVVMKQALYMTDPAANLEFLLHRAIIGAMMYGLVFFLTQNKRLSNRQLSALVPVSIALPEIAWVVLVGGEWLIYFFLIGCSLLGMLFLEFKGLLVSMTVNSLALAFCSFVLGVTMSGEGALTEWYDIYGFVALVFMNLLIYFTCRQFALTRERFRETGEAFSVFMETTPGFLAVINEHARVEHISRSLAEWFGISDSKYAKKRAFLDLCRKKGIMSAVQGVMEYGGVAEEALVIRQGDESRHFMLSSFPMGDNTVARTFEFTDVTSMAEAARAAEEASRQKSSFLANMSHEIRTPMNAIVGMTELMLTTPLNREQLSQAQAIKNSAMSLLTIINDILDFSKMSAEKMEISAAPFDTASFINDTLSIINIKASAAGLALTAAVSKNVPPQINGDEMRLKQCLLNLLNNAVKFTKSGSVSLAISCEHAKNGVKLNFMVKDTGIGIKKSEMDGLFEAFARLDTKKNREIVGTGLGLAITRRLIEMMGGKISVQSVYGEGSTFSFYVICQGRHKGELANLPNPQNYKALAYEPNKYHAGSLRSMLFELNVKHDICLELAEFEEKLWVGEYTHALYDKSAMEQVKKIPTQGIRTAVTKEMYDTNLDVPGFNKPLLITCLVRFLTGETEYDRFGRPGEIKLGAFQTQNASALLVDDNPVNLTVAEGMLRKYGIKVATAANGKEGFDMIRSADYDIAFFDHMMPVMDGVEAAAAIRALGGRFETVPIIALTANAMSGAEKMFLDAGMDGFLAKPIIIKELHRVLMEFLPAEKIVS